jgi:NAD(P)-dependent dehydrogenase (short-subunit alcohol dehydrogenase family)
MSRPKSHPIADAPRQRGVGDNDVQASAEARDAVCQNRISTWARFWEMPDEQWQTMIDVNLTGVCAR